jgi:hypothetical protein
LKPFALRYKTSSAVRPAAVQCKEKGVAIFQGSRGATERGKVEHLVK